MIDSSRHFRPIRAIKRIIDAMSWVKLNVLHWHLIDDQAFPVQIPSVATMWDGSFSLQERYTAVRTCIYIHCSGMLKRLLNMLRLEVFMWFLRWMFPDMLLRGVLEVGSNNRDYQ